MLVAVDDVTGGGLYIFPGVLLLLLFSAPNHLVSTPATTRMRTRSESSVKMSHPLCASTFFHTESQHDTFAVDCPAPFCRIGLLRWLLAAGAAGACAGREGARVLNLWALAGRVAGWTACGPVGTA